ncbi:MAG: hypothetical protein RL427_474 [Bacteroidota bacterium]|jgi:hypothetical protein
MNPQTYNIGNKNAAIKLQVNISVGMGTLITPDLVVYMDTPNALEPDTNSTDTDYFYALGDAKELGFALLKVEFTFDLKYVAPTHWEDCFDNLIITYTLSGGLSTQTYQHLPTDTKNKSTSGQIIISKKELMLTN